MYYYLQKLKNPIRVLCLSLVYFCVVSFSNAQSKTITGKVFDQESNEALPGANVIQKGTTNGTGTDIDGSYSLALLEGEEQIIIISSVGYISEEISVGTLAVIDVQLAPDITQLEEIVVVGYGVQKKETVVGAITQTKGADLKKQGKISRLDDALAGAMPGVTVLTGTGIPGGGGNITGNSYKETEILIRGKSTWNNSSPFILVDGVERNMADVDINEVESISVLKDASATAVYGVKGGNGVILITTKRGKEGKAKFTLEGNVTMENVSKVPQAMNSYDGIRAKNIAILNEAVVHPISWDQYVPDEILGFYKDGTYPYAYVDTNWPELMLKDFATSYYFNGNVSGGTKFLKYFTSLSYNHVGDIMATKDVGQGYDPQYSYDRFNFRSNLNFQLTPTTELITNLSGFYGAQQISGANYNKVWHGLYNHAPDWPVVQYEDGVYGFSNGLYERVGNNEYEGLLFSGYDRFNTTEVNSDFRIKQKLDFITEGLSATAQLAYDNRFVSQGRNINDDGVLTKMIDPEFYTSGGYWDEDSQSYMHPDPEVSVEDYTTYNFPDGQTSGFNWVKNPLTYSNEFVNDNNMNRVRRNLYYEVGINYARSFDKHDVTALALFSRQKDEIGSNWPIKREDWVGRMTYNYDSRYLVEINGSYNGSEKFGPGYKFDFFPSAALGWTISNESFFSSNLPWWNLLKFRYSDGMVGNDRLNNIQWGWVTTWSKGGRYDGNNQNQENFGNQFLVPGPLKYHEGTPGNPNLQWEVAHKRNLGIEFAFLKSKLTGSVDIFNENRESMLIASSDRNVPATFGQTAPAANIGKVKSHGFELEATFSNSHRNSLSYWVSANFTKAKNKVLEKEDPELKPAYQKAQGYMIGQTRTLLQSGVIESWDQMYTGVVDGSNNADYLPGDFRYIDFNSDGQITPDDGVPYGYSKYPINTYGFSGGISYKGFSIVTMFYGVFNVTRKIGLGPFAFDSPTMFQHILDDTWTPEYRGADPSYPHITFLKSNNSKGSYNSWDASLFRLKTLEVSYTLPTSLTERISMSKLRIYVNGNNLFVWTNMPVDGEGDNFHLKNYPVKKQLTVGLNVQF